MRGWLDDLERAALRGSLSNPALLFFEPQEPEIVTSDEFLETRITKPIVVGFGIIAQWIPRLSDP